MQLRFCLVVLIIYNCFSVYQPLPLTYMDNVYEFEEIDDLDKYIITDPESIYTSIESSFDSKEEIAIEPNTRNIRSLGNSTSNEDGSGEEDIFDETTVYDIKIVTIPPVKKGLPPSQNETTDEIVLPPSQNETTDEIVSPPFKNETTDEIVLPPSQNETTDEIVFPPSKNETTDEIDFPPSHIETTDKTILLPSHNETTDEIVLPPSRNETTNEIVSTPPHMKTTDKSEGRNNDSHVQITPKSTNTSSTRHSYITTTSSTLLPKVKLTTISNRDKYNKTIIEGQSTAEASISWLPVLIAAVISALIFFLLGVAFSKRCLQKKSQSEVITHINSDSPRQTKNERASFRNLQNVDIRLIRENSTTAKPAEYHKDRSIELETITEKTPLNMNENNYAKPAELHSARNTELEPITEKTPLNSTANSKDSLHLEGISSNNAAPVTTTFSTFKGKSQQSPINVDTKQTVFNNMYSEDKLRFKPHDTDTYRISNTGTTLKVYSMEETSTMEGGPLLKKSYQLDHIHFHWGSFDKGSEHTVDGEQFLAEIHFVHWDKDNFSTFDQAAKSKNRDALAVVAVLIKLGTEHNKLAIMTDNLSAMQYKGDALELIKDFRPHSLLPDNVSDYWSYPGSLTTAPFSENVTWIILKDCIEIAPGQIEELRQLRSHERDEGHGDEKKNEVFISGNFRKVQPIEQRKIQASFK